MIAAPRTGVPVSPILDMLVSMKSDRVAAIVGELYELVDRLEHLYPGRRFTLDGHLVGSIGEALAAEMYGLVLLPASAETHDATATYD